MLADLFWHAPLYITTQWGTLLEVNKKQSMTKFPTIKNTELIKI